MAIGDVQNRFNAGAQITRVQDQQNRRQVRPPERQENRLTQSAFEQRGVNNRNILQNQNFATQELPLEQRRATARQINQIRPQLVDLNNRARQVQAGFRQNRATERTSTTAPQQRVAENVLLDINGNEARNIAAAGRGENRNTVNRAAERTAANQINDIENVNAAAANTPAQLVAAGGRLTQENQLGTRLDTFA